MTDQTKTPVTVDGIDYVFEEMTQQQQMLLKHVADLNCKLDAALFNADQLRVGRDAFFAMLKGSLEATASEKPEDATFQPTVSAGMSEESVSESDPAVLQPTVGAGMSEESISEPDKPVIQPTVPAPDSTASAKPDINAQPSVSPSDALVVQSTVTAPL